MDNLMVTINDVAKACGVSKMTVSRAFTKDSVISEKTRERILRVSESMGYVPSSLASGLKSNRTNTIGIIIQSIENFFYLEMLKHLEWKLGDVGYKVIVKFLNSEKQDHKDALYTMFRARVDAIIMMHTPDDCIKVVMDINKNIPVLQMFSGNAEGVSKIIIDDRKGIFDATEYLINKGHTRIAYFGYGCNAEEKAGGYIDALKKHGITPEYDMISTEWIDDESRFLDILMKYKPSAVFAIARQGERAIGAFIKNGIKIPSDVSFMTYDDSVWARMLEIDTMAHPFDEFCDGVLRFLENTVQNKKQILCNDITLNTYVLKRKSVIDNV